MSPAYGYDDAGEREHEDCDWCGAGSCRDGSKCGLKPVEDYPGDDYDPLGFPCGHKVRTLTCGGCDPGAVAFTIDDFTGRVRPAPVLSPREREIVDRFEAAPDPFADDLWCYMHSPKLPCKHGVAWGDFCQACEDWLNGCTCGGDAVVTGRPAALPLSPEEREIVARFGAAPHGLCYEWPRTCEHFDDLDCFSAELAIGGVA